MTLLQQFSSSSPNSSPLKLKPFSTIPNSSPQFSPILSLKEVYLNSFKLKVRENCGELLEMVLKAFTFNGELCGELLENCMENCQECESSTIFIRMASLSMIQLVCRCFQNAFIDKQGSLSFHLLCLCLIYWKIWCLSGWKVGHSKGEGK